MSGQSGVVRDPYDLQKDPSLSDLLRVLERRVKLHIRTSVPATVVSFTPAPVPGLPPLNTGGNASVTVLVGTLTITRLANPLLLPSQAALVNPARGEVTLPPIKLDAVPVEYPGGSLGGVTFPIAPGDTGMLTISDRSLERWKLAGAPTDPVIAATHALEDAVFRPGLRAVPTTMSPVDMTATVLDGVALVKIGALAISAITKAEELIAVMDTAIAAAVTAAALITPPNGDGGTSGFTALQTAWDASKATILAIKGKVE